MSRNADAEAVQRALLELEARTQRRERAPPGKVKCPRGGRAMEPTRNGRVRVHDASPWREGRCAASGRAWKDMAPAG